MNKAIQAITQPGDVIWHSQPCTGGCPWQVVNMKRSQKTRDKVQSHWKLFESIWKAFERIATHAIRVGACVYHEWPQGCMYWSNKKVESFLKRNNFFFNSVHGCMYGLVSANGKTRVNPSRNPGTSHRLNMPPHYRWPYATDLTRTPSVRVVIQN